jgi:hypothetical protein
MTNERVTPHVKWLLDVASHLHAERRTAFANTCEQAAAELLAVSRHRDTLLAAHVARQPEPTAGHTAHCVKRLEDIGCDCGSGHTAECQLATARCTCGADDPPPPNRTSAHE